MVNHWLAMYTYAYVCTSIYVIKLTNTVEASSENCSRCEWLS